MTAASCFHVAFGFSTEPYSNPFEMKGNRYILRIFSVQNADHESIPQSPTSQGKKRCIFFLLLCVALLICDYYLLDSSLTCLWLHSHFLPPSIRTVYQNASYDRLFP